MGNCIKAPVASSEMLDAQYYLTHHGIVAENRALNNVILELREEIAELNNQIRFNNQLNIEHNNMIQQLTAEQRETKELIIKLKHEISQLEIQGKTNIIQEPFYGCIK
jgi:chromosome segregation ATPase